MIRNIEIPQDWHYRTRIMIFKPGKMRFGKMRKYKNIINNQLR